MTYVQYSNIAARCVRSALKKDFQVFFEDKGEGRGGVVVNFSGERKGQSQLFLHKIEIRLSPTKI